MSQDIIRLTKSDIQRVKSTLLKKQGYRCALCLTPLGPRLGPDITLDHDHDTGFVRAVLCRNCNGMEGRIKELVRRSRRGLPFADYLERIVLYWRMFDGRTTGMMHPNGIVKRTPFKRRRTR